MKTIFLTEGQTKLIELAEANKFNAVMLLNEENRTQKKKCVEIITNNCPVS